MNTRKRSLVALQQRKCWTTAVGYWPGRTLYYRVAFVSGDSRFSGINRISELFGFFLFVFCVLCFFENLYKIFFEPN